MRPGQPGARPGQPQGQLPRGPFGLPAFQQAPRQYFVPSVANRHHGEWGREPRFPFLPPLWQLPWIFGGLSQQLGQWGSGSPNMPGSVQFLSLGMGRFGQAFMNGYQRGQAQYAAQSLQQQKLYSAQLEQKLQSELDDYSQIFALYGDGKHGDQLYRALYAKASELGDQTTITALENEGPDAVLGLKKWIDAKYQDLHKANKAAKETNEQKEEEAWSGGQRQQQQQDPAGTAGHDASGRPIDIMGRPIAQPQQAQPPPSGGDVSGGALSDAGEEADAKAEYRGQQWSKEGVPKEALARIQHRAANLRAQEDAVRDTSRYPTEQDRYNALAKVDKAAADEALGVANYDIKVPYGREGMPPRIAHLAKLINPAFDQGAYQFIQEFRNPNSREGSTLQRSGSMAGAAEAVLEAGRVLIEKGKAEGKTADEVLNQMPIWNSIDMWASQKGLGDPEWTAFFQAYNSYVQEQVWVTRGGSGNEADIIRSLQAAPISNIRQVLATVSADSKVAVARIEQAKKDWDQNTQGRHGEALGYDPETLKIIHGVGTLDARDFTFGPDAPQRLRDIGLDGPGSPGMIEMKQRREQHERARLGVPKEATAYKQIAGKTYYLLNGKWMTD
jgi:hypothetical protein